MKISTLVATALLAVGGEAFTIDKVSSIVKTIMSMLLSRQTARKMHVAAGQLAA